MLKNPSTNVIIEAITLRGIGSYLSGARLEIKPLTILCGTNGSGKSTWLKALDILYNAMLADRLPFGFETEDRDKNDLQIMNSLCFSSDEEFLAQIAKIEEHGEYYGPLGTIGLELKLLPEANFFPGKSTKASGPIARKFLDEGTFSEPLRVKLRIAHPTHENPSLETRYLRDWIELTINDRHSLLLASERDPFQKFDDRSMFPKRLKPYRFLASRSFLENSDKDDTLVDLGTLLGKTFLPNEDWPDNPESQSTSPFAPEHDFANERVFRFITLFNDLVKRALDGYFHVGAIRKPYLDLETSKDLDETRYVGISGEKAWQVEYDYSYFDMISIEKPVFYADEIDDQWFLNAFSQSISPQAPPETDSGDDETREKLRRILEECRDKRSSKKMQRVFLSLPKETLQAVLAEKQKRDELDKDDSPIKYFEQYDENDEIIVANRLAYSKGLNALLESKTLFLPEIWGVEEVEFDSDNLATTTIRYPNQRIETLVHYGIENLDSEGLRQLNYLLILDAISEFQQSSLPTSNSLRFQIYLSHWLDWLLGVNLVASTPEPAGERSMYRKLVLPLPFVDVPNNRSYGHSSESSWGRPTWKESLVERRGKKYLNLARVNHPCFGGPHNYQPPRQLSAAFHQVFPIIVQLGVMKKGELLGLENPEVHLHPKLQIKIVELLIEHAKSGRRIIVETHCDLIIRRLLRAILEEDISQSHVEIFFTDLVALKGPNGISALFMKPIVGSKTSILQKVEVDEKGRINNWPEGFLDEGTREAGRLIDIMYGNQGSEVEDIDE